MATDIEAASVSAIGKANHIPSRPKPPVAGRININGIISKTHLSMDRKKAEAGFPKA